MYAFVRKRRENFRGDVLGYPARMRSTDDIAYSARDEQVFAMPPFISTSSTITMRELRNINFKSFQNAETRRIFFLEQYHREDNKKKMESPAIHLVLQARIHRIPHPPLSLTPPYLAHTNSIPPPPQSPVASSSITLTSITYIHQTHTFFPRATQKRNTDMTNYNRNQEVNVKK